VIALIVLAAIIVAASLMQSAYHAVRPLRSALPVPFLRTATARRVPDQISGSASSLAVASGAPMSAGWLAASSGDGTATTSLSCSGSFLRSSAHSSATARDHMLLELDAASRLAMSLNDLHEPLADERPGTPSAAIQARLCASRGQKQT